MTNLKEIIHYILYKEKEYLYFENDVEDSFSIDAIKRGLRRDDDGISLATISEYFIYNFDNRYVEIIMYEKTLTIGIPIFID